MNLYHVTKFSPYFSFTVYCFYTKISSFMLVLSTRIVLDCFYLLILYSEKFSTDVCRLSYAVNVNLNLSYVSFSTAGLHPGSWINRCSMFHVTIYVEKARVFGVTWRCFALVKCENGKCGFGKCCDCRESHLLCDLPKVLTDKSQVCAVELVLPEYFVPSIKTLRECLV